MQNVIKRCVHQKEITVLSTEFVYQSSNVTFRITLPIFEILNIRKMSFILKNILKTAQVNNLNMYKLKQNNNN